MKRALFLLAALAAAALCACQQAPVSSDASQPSPSSQSSQAPAAGEDELLLQESVPDGSTQASVSLHVPGDPGAEASLRVCLQGTDLGGKAFQRETELSGLQFCQASYSPSGHYFIVDGVESGSEYHALYGWEVLPSGSTSYCLTGKLENACYYCASIQPKLKEAHGTWRDIHFSFVRWHEEQDRMLMEYAGTAPDDSPFGGSFWFDLETLAAIPAQSSDPDAAPQYSTVLQETSVYTLDAQGLSPEEGAYLLAGQFMDSMMEESDRRTFRITEYRDLTVADIDKGTKG